MGSLIWTDDWDADGPSSTIPHCDSRVCHSPGECRHCDAHPSTQAARIRNGVAFTGHPGTGLIPCPADTARPPGTKADHRRWGGNKPTSAVGDPAWPAETVASLVMYGDQGGRAPWPITERVYRRMYSPVVRLGYWLQGYEVIGSSMVYRLGAQAPLGRYGRLVGVWLVARRP